jgi:hypothetical protein
LFKQIFNPDLYHGTLKKKKSFEGWYFKVIDRSLTNAYAFIPGIFLDTTGDNSHSFLQVLCGSCGSFNYIQFPTEAFHYDKDKFKVHIGENHFSSQSFSISVDEPSLSISGILFFKDTKKWPASIINPGSMGFYNYLPFMQCYTQVCIMNGTLEGSLIINGRETDFTGGSIYVEKNWGKSFPQSWIWVQSNSFYIEGACLTCSLGYIPFPFRSFRGFLIGFHYNGSFYSFTTINRSKLRVIDKNGHDVVITASNYHNSINIETSTDADKFILCKGPSTSGMSSMVKETLSGEIKVNLWDIKNCNSIFSGTGKLAGIEYGGDMSIVMDP